MKKVSKILLVCNLIILTSLFVSCFHISESKDDKSEKEQLKEGEELSYRKAVKEANFEEAYDILAELRSQYSAMCSKDGILNRDERKEAELKFYDAFDYIYKGEVQYILSEFNAQESTDKILFLLEEVPVIGEKFPEGLCDYDVVCRGDWGDEGIPLDAYIVWTQHYNRLCNTILALAINRKNKELAKQVLSRFVENVEAIKGGSHGDDIVVDGVKVDGNHGYIKYTKDDATKAKNKYDEAVSSGSFN